VSTRLARTSITSSPSEARSSPGASSSRRMPSRAICCRSLRASSPIKVKIMITEHVGDRARGRIVTSDDGPVFFNQPREGAGEGACWIWGGGDDRPMHNPASRRRSPEVHARLLALRDKFYPELAGQPPSAEWVGPMAFTPDGLPCIGFLRPGLVIAAGYNGYGGSYATAAGQAAAEMAITDAVPDALPEEIFSPLRLLSDEPLFLTERKGTLAGRRFAVPANSKRQSAAVRCFDAA